MASPPVITPARLTGSVATDDGVAADDHIRTLNPGTVSPYDGVATDNDIGTLNLGAVATDDGVAAGDDIRTLSWIGHHRRWRHRR